MTTTPKPHLRHAGKALFTVTKSGVLIVNNRTQFERFRRHGVPADQMRISTEIPKS